LAGEGAEGGAEESCVERDCSEQDSDTLRPLKAETMQLTDNEKEEIKALLDRGEPLPDKYRFALFKEPREAELIWPGKTHEVTNVVLPFQSIEQIDEPRSETAAAQSDLF
jgi:hypothetical protein